MLINNEPFTKVYDYTGVNVFAIDFPFYGKETITLHYVPSGSAYSSEGEPMVYGVHYTVEGIQGDLTDSLETFSGGFLSITSDGAALLAIGTKLILSRHTPIEQLHKYNELDNFPAKSHENSLGLLTVIAQELSDDLTRTIKLSPASTLTPEQLVDNLLNAEQAAGESAASAKVDAESAAASATAAQKSADDAAQSAAEAGAAAGEEAVARVEAEGDKQTLRVQTEGDTVLSSMAELASTAFLPGMVVAFTGSFGGEGNKYPIPTGSTEPDLTWRLHEPSAGRFILGGNTGNQHHQGGTPYVGGTTGATTLTEAQMPYHAHNFPVYTQGQGGTQAGSTNGVNINAYNNTHHTGGSQPHTHVQNLPPYYILAYIEKLPSSGGGSGDVFVSQETFNNAVTALENGKQDTLEAGDNITIVNNVISATGGGGGGSYDDTEIKLEISSLQKQVTYATPNEKGMVRVQSSSDVVTLHLSDDAAKVVTTFPLKGKPIKILCIGNSYSLNALDQLHEILTAAGQNEFIIGSGYISGGKLEDHYNNALTGGGYYQYHEWTEQGYVAPSGSTSITQMVTKHAWDIVLLQQYSGYAGMYETITPYLQTLINFVKDNKINANAVIGYHTVWAYPSTVTSAAFAPYNYDTLTMYKAEADVSRFIVRDYADIDVIVPSNTVIQNARGVSALSGTGILAGDGHLYADDAGALLSLGVMKHIVYPYYGIDIQDVTYDSLSSTLKNTLSQQEFDAMLPVVEQSFLHPYDVDGSYEITVAVQKPLVSGTTIKTINNQSLLGSGNITISGGSGSEPSVIEDLVSTDITVTLAGNTVYKYGELTSLTIEAQDSSYVQSLLYFTSGNVPTVITYPEDAGYIPNAVTIEADTAYAVKVQGGYFEVLKRVVPVEPEPPTPSFTEYTDYTPIQGYCSTWDTGVLRQEYTVDSVTSVTNVYEASLSTPAVISKAFDTFALRYTTSSRPLSLPAGTKIQILAGASVRICKGSTLANGSRGNNTTGESETILTEDSIVMINIGTSFNSYQETSVLREDLNTKLKILVPSEKLSQVNNNEV